MDTVLDDLQPKTGPVASLGSTGLTGFLFSERRAAIRVVENNLAQHIVVQPVGADRRNTVGFIHCGRQKLLEADLNANLFIAAQFASQGIPLEGEKQNPGHGPAAEHGAGIDRCKLARKDLG